MVRPYRSYAVWLVLVAFAPLWICITGWTYLNSYPEEWKWFLHQALHYCEIFGLITVVAPLVKLRILKGMESDRLSLSPRRLLLVTILETVMIFVSAALTAWICLRAGNPIGLKPWFPRPWAIGLIFAATACILSVVPNMLLIGVRGSGEEDGRTIADRLLCAILLACIAPVSVTILLGAYHLWGKG
jgi:hypothetical protein